MTTKQQQSATQSEDWDAKLELTAQNLRTWLLGGFDKQKQTLDEVKRRMQDKGISSELIKRCIHYESLPEENVKRDRGRLKLVSYSRTTNTV